jgi:hypothetical protein
MYVPEFVSTALLRWARDEGLDMGIIEPGKPSRAVLQKLVFRRKPAGQWSRREINAHIRRIKARACGLCNRERFRAATYFLCGGLDRRADGVDRAWLPT